MEAIKEWYHLINVKNADPRFNDWFLMSSPLPTIGMCFAYVAIVHWGQKWMKDRQAYDLKYCLVIYNFLLVLLSVYMFHEVFVSTVLRPEFHLLCQAVDYKDEYWPKRLGAVIWWFYFSKLIEFLDTIFFVLRKKNSQITFLHVYHHFTMPLLWYSGVKWVGGGCSYYAPLANSFIHTLMYTYYMLAAVGPQMQPYLWWKKYMTKLQLFQFVSMISIAMYGIIRPCGFPPNWLWAQVVVCFTYFVLFCNFYYQAYVKRARERKFRKAEQSGVSNGHVANGHLQEQNGFANANGYANGHAVKVD